MTLASVPARRAVPTLTSVRRAWADGAFRIVSFACGVLVLAVLALIVVSMTDSALPAFRESGLGFVTGTRWAPNDGVFGSLAFVYGTLVVSCIALVLAVPVSIGIALFLSEVAPVRLRRAVSYLVDLLAAIPSVVFGLWGVLVLAPFLVGPYEGVASGTSSVPLLSALFEGPVNGKSLFTAGLILALMVTPIITAITREIFATVPAGQKEAAIALGATRWEMIRGAVFPHSRNGVIGAVMLGLGRAMGETIAVALVIGSSPQVTARLFASGDNLAAVIANQFGEAGGVYRSALIGLGVVLFAMTVVVNVAARVVVTRGTANA
jgi:phosphate transport system permease protein